MTGTVTTKTPWEQYLRNIRMSSEICHCYKCQGRPKYQLDAELVNGQPIRIMRTWAGYHVAIGFLWDCPEPVSAAQVEQMILDALGKKASKDEQL